MTLKKFRNLQHWVVVHVSRLLQALPLDFLHDLLKAAQVCGVSWSSQATHIQLYTYILQCLLHCLKYSSLRTDFFNNIGYVSSPLMSDFDCVKFLLTNFPRQTANFINSAYMYRQSLLHRKRYA